jgi:hypothetical protein
MLLEIVGSAEMLLAPLVLFSSHARFLKVDHALTGHQRVLGVKLVDDSLDSEALAVPAVSRTEAAALLLDRICFCNLR